MDRQRRHDEAWQREVVDGLARVLDVLHDISDSVRRLAATINQRPVESPMPPDGPELLSVNGLAERLGISPGQVRTLRATGQGPTATQLGSRVYFDRDDVTAWLEQQRVDSSAAERPWREALLPGRIGSGLPMSSEPRKREFCVGSHSEPLAASRWAGRAVCRVCRDDVLVNRTGLLRKHYSRWW